MADNLPQPVDPDAQLPEHFEGDRHIRQHMAAAIERMAKDRHSALGLLERFDRALWATALSGSDSAELARHAYEIGASEFLRQR